jgi:hypothetical protein
MSLKSTQIIYSEHHYDECFEYINGEGRVAEGDAIGYEVELDDGTDKLILFDDIKYSKYDHDYWDNYELEQDVERIVIP